jgi:hypothetical protein
LSPVTSGSEKISFRQVNKETGNRIRYKKVDSETGEEVESEQIGKGYETGKNEYGRPTRRVRCGKLCRERTNCALPSPFAFALERLLSRTRPTGHASRNGCGSATEQ